MSKFLFQPVKPFVLNQGFGENQACVHIKDKYVITCDGNNPPEGFKSLYGPGGHKGLDLRAYHGQPVYASCAGIVEFIDTNPKSGLDVKIVSEVDGKKYRHIYEHLLGYQVKVGEKVGVGALIGWADNTGYSAGDHLHYQLELWDGKKWVAIDPIPLMDTMFALQFAGYWRQMKELTAIVADLVADFARRKQ